MANRTEYKELCEKIDRLMEEVRELQQAVHQLKLSSGADAEAEKAWANLMNLAQEVSAR